MQKSQLDNKAKSRILAIVAITVLLVSVPLSLSNFEHKGFHVSVHILSIILAAFLSTIGAITYKEFKNKRLFLVMCAFVTILIAEIIALSTYVTSFAVPNTSIDSLITHSLILLMLSFFVVGIFRTD